MKDTFNYKKSLGQNFLIDKNIINKIIDEVDVNEDDLIIEIGPGSGALTKELRLLNANVFSFEIDKRLEKDLLELESNNVHFIFQDFLKVDLKKFLIDKKYKRLFFVGNLPYYITSAIINKIINECDAYKIIIMIQKEVGLRYMANPCSKDYSSITVHLQYNFDIKKVCDVSKNCFYPVPKVDSMVLKLVTKEKAKLNDRNLFESLIRASFALKRKNIRNNLKKYDLEIVEEVLGKYNKDLTSRAEEITVNEFVEISNALFESNKYE